MMRPILGLLALACFGSACGSDAVTTTPSTVTSPAVETFSGVLSGGRAWRVITVKTAGVMSLTLTDSGSPSTPIGLGLGIPGSTGTCILSLALVSEGSTSPQITAPVDVGDYCAEVHDVRGPNATPVRFSLSIEHP